MSRHVVAATPPARAKGDAAVRQPRVIGRYRLVREQGTGLFGTVWLAEDTGSGDQVALRLLPRELTDVANVAETVRRRSRAIVEASRAHPGLVKVLEYGATEDGTLYAVMERVEGRRLSEVLAERSRPDVPGALRLAVEMGGPVETLHNMGLLHGALWPRNFAVADGRVTLMDVETIALRDAAALQPLVAARGPESYLAPEQIQGRSITEKTDVYAFAATLYEMVAGRPPFEAPTREAVLDKHLKAAPPVLRRSRRTVPASIEATLMEALDKRPEARPFMPRVLNHIATEAGTGASRRWQRVAALTVLSAGLVITLAIALPLAWSVVAPRWSSLSTPPPPPPATAPETPAPPPAAETKSEPPVAAEKRAEPTPSDPLPGAPAPSAATPPGPSAPPPAVVAAPPAPAPPVSPPVAPVVPPPASVVTPPSPGPPAAPSGSVAVPAESQPPAPPASTVTPFVPRPPAPPATPPATPVAPPAPPAVVTRPAAPRPATPPTPAPQADRPRAAAPAPARSAPASAEEPDPAAVIDWLLNRRKD